MRTAGFQDITLSALGFGCMRLPLLADGSIDEPQVKKMVDYAIDNGINYFDTAFPYHGGNSELVLGRALASHPRDSYYLATKYPGHQIASSYDPAGVFEEQLKKCGVDYFDFYLLHNICENSLPTYENPKWGILEYFREQKRNGRIKHLGFSSHARPETLRHILEEFGADMEFCQIQLNYLDWTLQDAKQKVEILNGAGIPIWVMESVRGGKLANLRPEQEERLRKIRPEMSDASWGYRWLMDVPGVTMILSGMSSFEQMRDNVKTFSEEGPLSSGEKEILADLAEGMKDSLPCTACRYCTEGCPKGLDIPMIIAGYNDLRVTPTFNISMQFEALAPEKRPSACIGCGRCAKVCPQKIDIPKAMKDFSALLDTMPKWSDICREREEAAKKLRK